MDVLSRCWTRRVCVTALAVMLPLSWMGVPTRAQAADSPSKASEASGISLAIPVAISVIGPIALLSAGATFTIVSIQASATGTAWVLERVGDGSRVVVRWGGEAAKSFSNGVGKVVEVTATSAGQLLSVSGEVIGFIPNDVGRTLIYHEQMTY
ncbi:MAG: hypothetical protein AB3X41_00805 [Leptothrix ochracea]|uniref:hypothetical protein n=1 Tax=Leptothrix ochracea TaxID=735331 RepID=UPI0034E2B2C6